MAIPTTTNTAIRKRGARGTATVTTTKKRGAEVVAERERVSQDITAEVGCANPAYVSVNGGLTKNMGDYNSVKIGVSVTLPCLPEAVDIEQTYRKCSEFVDKFMDEEYKNAISEA